MSTPASTADGGTASSDVQTFTIVRMHRSALVGAPYNPRGIRDKARAALKKGIKKHGIVEPPVWNKRTGHIVSGHQRLSIRDELAGSSDYELDVAVVDKNEAEEKELNILLNNGLAMGEYDVAMLSEMFKDQSIDIDGTGFSTADVYNLFGDTPFQSEARAAGVQEMADKFREVAGAYDKVTKKKSDDRNKDNYYIVVVFKSFDECGEFLAKHGLENNRFQDGREVASRMKDA